MEFKDLVLRDSADYQIVPIPSLDKRIRKKKTQQLISIGILLSLRHFKILFHKSMNNQHN